MESVKSASSLAFHQNWFCGSAAYELDQLRAALLRVALEDNPEMLE